MISQKAMRPNEYIPEAEWLFEAGLDAMYVCAALGIDPRTLNKAAWRTGNIFVYERTCEYAAAVRYERSRRVGKSA